MLININNVEDLVFMDKSVWSRIPELSHLRDQWRLSKMTPSLRAMGKKAMLDFLNDSKSYEDSLSEYFGRKVTIDKVEPNSVKNSEFSVSEDHVNPEDAFSEICLHREGEKVGMTLWR